MPLEPERFESAGPMTLAGTDQYYAFAERGGVADQWSTFNPLPDLAVECAGYGVSHAMDERGFRYLCGVRVAGESGLPDGLEVVRLPSRRYAVFIHRGHVSTLCRTCDAIFRDWLPASGCAPAEDAVMMERYAERFDPRTGSGEVEIWLALRS